MPLTKKQRAAYENQELDEIRKVKRRLNQALKALEAIEKRLKKRKANKPLTEEGRKDNEVILDEVREQADERREHIKADNPGDWLKGVKGRKEDE